YGTLRKEYPYNPQKSLIDNLRFIGIGTIEGELYDIGDYPAAIKRKTSGKIVGDVFLLNNSNETWNVLDRYEECSGDKAGKSEFLRTKTRVLLDSGKYI